MSGLVANFAMAPALKASIEASKVQYKQLGRSGLKVSVPVLGAMSFGNKSWVEWMIEAEEAMPILKAAYDRGVNSWDTAPNYANGNSEKIIGQAIKKYDLPRRKLVLMTKVYGCVADQEDLNTSYFQKEVAISKDYVNQFGLSRKSIFNSVENSLKRLGTDYIDLLQVHRFDKNTPIEETMEALHDLVRSGKVHYIGASSMFAFEFAMMQAVAEQRGWSKFISMQNHYSLVYREEEREMNKYCNLTGVGLIPWSPLARGHLARPVASKGSTTRSHGEMTNAPMFSCGTGEPDETIIGRVQELAEKKGWTMSQVALAWINKRVTSPILGISSVKRLDEALESRGKVLTDEEEKYLEELYVPKAIQGHV